MSGWWVGRLIVWLKETECFNVGESAVSLRVIEEDLELSPWTGRVDAWPAASSSDSDYTSSSVSSSFSRLQDVIAQLWNCVCRPPQVITRAVRALVSNKYIAVRKVATLLRELTCHMGSHSVTCHPAEVTFPPLPQPKLVLD